MNRQIERNGIRNCAWAQRWVALGVMAGHIAIWLGIGNRDWNGDRQHVAREKRAPTARRKNETSELAATS
jgi:hypothetical protein